jgi:hypothetical protein
MSTRVPLFKGLVVDEKDEVVQTGLIGTEPCYIVDDTGFKRHIPSEEIDLEVLGKLGEQVKGNEEFIADQTAKMTGQDDLFSHAFIENQLKNMDKQFSKLLETGLPEDARAYLGMMGFKVVIDIHGAIVRIDQPGSQVGDEGPGDDN